MAANWTFKKTRALLRRIISKNGVKWNWDSAGGVATTADRRSMCDPGNPGRRAVRPGRHFVADQCDVFLSFNP